MPAASPASCPCLAAVVSGALAGCCLSTTVLVPPGGGFSLANFSQNGSFYFQRYVTISISFHLSPGGGQRRFGQRRMTKCTAT
ncbi:hypothetical protein C8J56DRAFT_945718, partial [Mycena floridula]